jgi:stage III sporulation protein AG
MTGFLKKLFEKKDKKFVMNLATAAVFGILLIVTGNAFFKTPKTTSSASKDDSEIPVAETSVSYEMTIEQKLKSIYELVEGAGKVSVMVTLSHGKEIVVAEDAQKRGSSVTERDANGGVREQNEFDEKNTKIIISGANGDHPLILKELEPAVEGVIIVTQGGDNAYVRSALTKATAVALGVEPHKIQVLKMKNGR